MGSPLSFRPAPYLVFGLLLHAAAFACSSPDNGNHPQGGGAGGSGGQAGSGVAGSSGAPSAGAAGLGAGGTGGTSAAGGSAGSLSGGGKAGGATAGAASAGSNVGGAGAGSGHAGAGGKGGGGAGGGSAGMSAQCQMIKAEYAKELDKQLNCNPSAGSQCDDRVDAAPGCECRVFIQPSDPFAIEHLANVANGWFDEDCTMPSCPATCSNAASGTCQASAGSPLGGRCVTP